MVTTFLLHTNFSQSAKLLDYRRLGKQRLEAKEIWEFLKQLRLIASLFNIEDFPREKDTSVEERQNWITKVMSSMKDRNIKKIILRNDQVSYVYKGDNGTYKSDDNQKVITLAYKGNPAVRLWLGFEDGLLEYYNAHVREWISRGYKNTMPIFDVKNSPRPKWTYNDDIIRRFKSMLMKRELERNENLWYSLKRDFVFEFVHDKYSQTHSDKLDDITGVLFDVIIFVNNNTSKKIKWWEILPNSYLLEYGDTRGYLWL